MTLVDVAEIELIGVPFDGYGRLGNQALASVVLRGAGLAGAFDGHRVIDPGDLDLPPPDPGRGKDSGMINERALVAMTDQLNGRVSAAVKERRLPVIFGGDCASLLGTVSGLRDSDVGFGLLFVDGHEDAMPLDVSEDGEAANAEIGLLLGITGRLIRGPLRRRLPALSTRALAMLGQRDEDWRRRFNVGSLRDHGVWLRSIDEVKADPGGAAESAVRHLRRHADRWWLHVDLDVLDPDAFAAQGLPDVADDPGGLSWRQLTELLVAAVGAGGCLGLSLAIYDPDQDPDGSDARRIVALVGDVAAALGASTEVVGKVGDDFER